jgi:hypothetical protein
MSKNAIAAAGAGILLSLLAGATSKTYIIERLEPDPPKKAAQYSAEGGGLRYRDARLDVAAVPLLGEARSSYFTSRGVVDPFDSPALEPNYVLFRVRLENLMKDEALEFSPGSAMFGNSNALDEIGVYQLFYKEVDGEARLAAAGKTLFLRHLRLPPGEWIERLMVFQYDDPYPTKKITLVLSSILLGRDGVDLEFPFRASYRKEKTA